MRRNRNSHTYTDYGDFVFSPGPSLERLVYAGLKYIIIRNLWLQKTYLDYWDRVKWVRSKVRSVTVGML